MDQSADSRKQRRIICILQVVSSMYFFLFPLVTLSILSYAVVARQEAVPIVFVQADGTEKEVMAEIGKNLLDVAHDNNVELEGMYPR